MTNQQTDISWQLSPFDDLSPQRLYDILKLRQRVFVVEQDCVYLDMDDLDQGAMHLTTYSNDGLLLAYARLLPPGLPYKEASIGRIITAPEVRRDGWGIKLMHRSIEEVNRLYDHPPIRIMAQCYLSDFYGKFDFVPQGEPFMEDGIPHIEMLRKCDPVKNNN